MDNLLQTGGAGGLGAVLGALISFFGLKDRIITVDKRVDSMVENVVFKDSCKSTVSGIQRELDSQTTLITEVRDDIKDILKEMKKT